MVKFWAGALTLGLTAAGFSAGAQEKLTYSKDIAPILNESCVGCHRPGEIGPMSLLNYAEVRPWVKSIARNVSEGKMPPWHADEGYGPFVNDRSLSDEAIAKIVAWAEQGAPQGKKSDLPPAPKFPESKWALGEPDYVIELDAVEVPGEGPDQFYDLEVKTELEEDTWLRAVDILPGDRRVVHHVILWQGANRQQDGWIGAWAAGGEAQEFPEGTGRTLKKGTTVIANMHYHPTGEAATDKTKIGFYFAKDNKVEKELTNLWVMNAEFEIPPGDPNHRVESEFTFAQDSTILTVTPHMHYRGKDFKYTLHTPDGKVNELLKVSDYDFNWQTVYEFEQPVDVPAGSRLHCVAHFDNSADNPANPDPTKAIRFGNESYDEMMIGFVDYVVKDGIRPKPVADPVGDKGKQLAKQFPGEVYMIEINQGGGSEKAVAHLPREGEGGVYVKFGSIVGKAAVRDIVWNGNSFESMMFIPGQEGRKMTGTIGDGTVDLKMHITEEMAMPISGTLID